MSNDTTCPPTLSDLGISRDQSSRYQKLADMGEGNFETAATIKSLQWLPQQCRFTVLEHIMWLVIFWIFMGIFIGWNLPQPGWAKSLQDKIVTAIKDAWNK